MVAILIDTGIYGSSLLKDFLMAEFEFVQVKRTFDDKLKVVELAGANKRLSQIVASSGQHLVAAASDQAYTIH